MHIERIRKFINSKMHIVSRKSTLKSAAIVLGDSSTPWLHSSLLKWGRGEEKSF
jgi:hypothetical protein